MKFASAFDRIKSLCRDLREKKMFFFVSTMGYLDLEISSDSKTLYEPSIKVFGNAITGLDTDI